MATLPKTHPLHKSVNQAVWQFIKKHHTVYRGEEIGLILWVESIRQEEMAEGMVPLGIDNVVVISTTMAIKPTPSHYIWDMLHQRVAMTYNKHKKLDLLVKWTLAIWEL